MSSGGSRTGGLGCVVPKANCTLDGGLREGLQEEACAKITRGAAAADTGRVRPRSGWSSPRGNLLVGCAEVGLDGV